MARIAHPAAGPRGIWIVSTHLDHATDAALAQQIGELGPAVQELREPVVVAGAFNVTPGHPLFRRMLDGSFGSLVLDSLSSAGANGQFTSPSLHPRRRIDFVLHDAAFTASAASVAAGAARNSEHLPFVTTLTLPPPDAVTDLAAVCTAPNFGNLSSR